MEETDWGVSGSVMGRERRWARESMVWLLRRGA